MKHSTGARYMEPDVLEHILDGREKQTNLPLEFLKKITLNFSKEREIGHGGFATVYKGVLPKGNVAVKRIRNSHTIDEKLFYGEVNSLLMINHPNIVRFLGFCASTDQRAIKVEGKREHIYAEIRERLLCFEYISNGNLQKHITDELRGLEWSTRYQLIKGICDGLHYLHMEKHIYHMDLKPANILLDNDMVPKITDFGLSRLDEKSQTMSVERHGTLGYCAPEYLHCGKMSFKSDIYSLGTIIIELVTGEKSIPDNNKNNALRRWRHRWRKTGKETPLGYQQVIKCIDIGLLCQEIDPCKRPFIWEIVCDINELEDTYSQISNDNESTVGQISPYSEDDMLGIEPLELHFPFKLDKQMSCLLDLTNNTDSHIAFEVQKMSPLLYCAEPHEGIVPPHSTCCVDITLQAQHKAPQCANEFIVRSTRVNNSFTTDHIGTTMFSKYTGNVVDEVNLDVIFDQLHTEPEGLVPEVPKSKGVDWFSRLQFTGGLGRLQIIKNDDLEYLQELGPRNYGTVYHGKWRGSDVAIKRINDECFTGNPSEEDKLRNDFWNEASNVADLQHPNVVAFYGVVLDGPGESIATVTEYMVNGSLGTALLKNSKSLDQQKRLIIAMDIAFGMEYLHNKSIVHFDLTSENLLVNLRDPQRPICKVGDLGLSEVMCENLISGGVKGTLQWMAPELLKGSSSLVSEKVDVFSFGIVLWELLTGEKPYAHLHYGAIIAGIVNNTLRPQVPDSCDPEWRSLMEQCWATEASERPSFTQIAVRLRSMAASQNMQ